MVKFMVDEIRGMMDQNRNIRNISILSHVSSGRSTVTNMLLIKSGISISASANNQESSTIKSTIKSMFFALEEKDFKFIINSDQREKDVKGFLINLIDFPGRFDLSAITPALRVSNGTLILVDCLLGVGPQTKILLRQALVERVEPIVFINKMDCALFELRLDPEDIYQNFRHIVENVNGVITSYDYNVDLMGEFCIDPRKGSIGFGSGLYGWAFTLQQIAEIYSDRFKIDIGKLMKKLWGENFYNENTKEWSKEKDNNNRRSFCLFVLDPVYKIYHAIMNYQKDKYEAFFSKLGIILTPEDKDKDGKELLRAVMSTWFPADKVLLQMIAIHLPSPVTAQKYRMETLYEGPDDDKAALGIKNCDPNAPLMMYISNLVPTSDKGQFYAIGRVFSGKVATGIKARIIGPNYSSGKKDDLYEKTIEKTILTMSRSVQVVEDVPAGNICALIGIDGLVGTVTTFRDAYNIKATKSSNISSEKNTPDLPKRIETNRRRTAQ